MIDEQDEAVFADSAYQSESSDKLLIENDCQNFILFKARRGHPLTAEEVATNKQSYPSALRTYLRPDEPDGFGQA